MSSSGPTPAQTDTKNDSIRVDESSLKQLILDDNFIGIITNRHDSQSGKDYRLLRLETKTANETSDSEKKTFALHNQHILDPSLSLSPHAIHHDIPEFFRGNGAMHRPELSIIVSVKSGICQAEDFFHSVVKELLNVIGVAEDSYKVYFTESERWISEFAIHTISQRANQGILQSILLLSGDGGVIDIINGLYSQPQSLNYIKPRIGLLVLGTGNALANSLEINQGNTKGLPNLLGGRPRSIPTFIARFSPGSVLLVDEARRTEHLPIDDNGDGVLHGAVVASWALHATLVADSDTAELRRHGSARFAMAANELLAPSDGSTPHKWKGKITTWHKSTTDTADKKVWDRHEHVYILATLVAKLEAALTISPDSKPLDGQLRLIDFPPLPADTIKEIFGLAYAGGKHIAHDSVGYTPIERLRIDFEESHERWRRVCIDGKIVRVPEHGWFEVSLEPRRVADLIVG